MSLVSEEKSWLEWLVFAISALLILTVVGFLVYDLSQDEGLPPEIHVTLGEPVQAPHGFMVPVAVTNKGQQTAQEVMVEVTSGGTSAEQAEIQIDFLSAGEVRRGWVGFSGASAEFRFKTRVKGYRTD